MRYQKAFIPTVKEVPKDATNPSHRLLLRGGYARMVGAGIYEMLPLGLRVMQKIATIVREEIDRAGGQELLMPSLLPSEYFKESGRWDGFGDTLLRLTDRKGGEYHLSPTHEEIITDLVRREIKSYRQLPQLLYQVQMKHRDEPRPRAGLLRCREFLMKDAYSFDRSEEDAVQSYQRMRDAYHRIFQRLGLDYRIVQADSGAMGGSTSAEFQVLASTGEDAIVACGQCDYAANVEVAEAAQPSVQQADASGAPAPEKVATPDAKTIDAVSRLLEVPAERLLKSVVYVAGEQTVMAVVRGDHEVNEIKLARHLGLAEVRLANETELRKATGAPMGFAGPVGFSGRILADLSVASLADAVCGANEKDAHLTHVFLGRDFEADLVDLRSVDDGDRCVRCGGELKGYRGIEGGHIFILGTHYSSKMQATFQDEGGKPQPFVMGCYGIGISRLVAAAIEQHHDEAGIAWPMAIAPYQVMVTPIGKGDEVREAAERLYAGLLERGVQVLLDDRDERPGVKFKDAELIGIPLRLTVGARGVAEGSVELNLRATGETEKLPMDSCLEAVVQRVLESGSRLSTGTH